MGIKKILETIFEVDFLDVSFGFRPNRSCHDALDVVDKAIMIRPVNYVVDMDIEKFFDTVDHKWLMKCLQQRIIDPNLLRLIVRFLKAGVLEEGKYYQIETGFMNPLKVGAIQKRPCETYFNSTRVVHQTTNTTMDCLLYCAIVSNSETIWQISTLNPAIMVCPGAYGIPNINLLE